MINLFKTFFGKVGSWLKTCTKFTYDCAVVCYDAGNTGIAYSLYFLIQFCKMTVIFKAIMKVIDFFR